MAFRVEPLADGAFNIEPVIQKRGRGGVFSKGARCAWYQLSARPGLTVADERVYQAYDEPPAARGHAVGRVVDARAGVRHPAGADRSPGRVPGRRARERRTAGHPPGTAAAALRQRRRRQPGAAVRPAGGHPAGRRGGRGRCATSVTCCTCTGPRAAARSCCWPQLTPAGGGGGAALALAPARFPPEAHDALATRLEALQETMDIEFPSQWTRTIAPADEPAWWRGWSCWPRARLQVRLAVRPVKLGPVFAPGEGPALVLEGQGRDRHGARRDRQQRAAGGARAGRTAGPGRRARRSSPGAGGWPRATRRCTWWPR